MIWTYKTTVDLDKPYQPTLWKTIASVGNKKAHGFEIRVVKSGVPVDLAGSTVELSAKRQDGATRYLQGEISNDNAAVAELDAPCYEVEGQLKCTMTISQDDTVFSAACIYLLIDKADGDAIVDPSHTIPSVSELLKQIETIKTATQAANTATENANTAASNANTARDAANTAASTANTAAANANAAKDAANAAAGKINNMTVSATPVETGTSTAALTTVDGHYHLALGLPKGDTGATPQISVQVQTGASGSEASVSVSGTAENPVIHLTIPRGDTGAIENLTINGKPVESGTITLTAEDVGAVTQPTVEETPGEAPSINAGTFGGMTVSQFVEMIYPVGSIYMSASATSPETLFGGTWESISGRFLLGADATYAAGSMGGADKVTIGSDNIPQMSKLYYYYDGNGSTIPSGYCYLKNGSWEYSNGDVNGYTNSFGPLSDAQSHNNMPPYLAVYMWQRTA